MEFRRIKTEENIEKAIVRAVAFFDLFNYPLTSQEIWQYTHVKCDMIDLMRVLKISSGLIEEKNGFYFLRGRDKIIKTRMERYNFTDKKFKRALKVARIFKLVPWIKMIAVSNIIGAHNLKKESDIDLFIITEPGRVWVTRFFCVVITKILRLRPKEGNARNKICLSFFISVEAMDLRGLMLKDKITDSSAPDISDIYFIYWLTGLVSIYDANNTYEKFIEANSWIKEYLPNWQPAEVNYRRNAGQGFSWFYRDAVDMIIGGLEKELKKIQLKIMPETLKSIMNKDTRVVVNNQILKLYANDRRAEYRDRLKEKLATLREVGADLM